MRDRERQRFGTEELAVVLSHYDLGVIESVTAFDRGSRWSPKAGIVCEKGKFLLKKRAVGRRSEKRVALAHRVQQHLQEQGYPLPALVPTRRNGQVAVRIGHDCYELFEFVPGVPYGFSADETRHAGELLGRFHDALRGFGIPEDAPVGSYHDVNAIRTALNSVPQAISSHDSVMGQEAALLSVVTTLYHEYDSAAEAVNELDILSLPTQLVHADWHPGNMLFRKGRVAAVVDYDSCRVSQRVTDVANGALHFSLASGGHPDQWPDHADTERLAAFMQGYGAVKTLSQAERRCIALLMIEALIAEAVAPIAHTGSFGRWTGFGFLRMVSRKVQWLLDHADEIADYG